ncbi:MAG: hypothetical protein J5792_06140 [Bacteroidales bacterium]|nr:hypothetical protein [Bacteroidales bacterium]
MKALKKKKWVLAFALFCCGDLAAQNVTHISAQQVEKYIHVSYDLDKQATVTLYLSTDGGRTYTELHRVSGDVGKNVTAGHKVIVWDVLAEREELVGDDILFKVKAGNAETVMRKEQQKKVKTDNSLRKHNVPYCTFFTLNSAYSPLPQWSYGFKMGGMKTAGWYISAMSNFNFAGWGSPFDDGGIYALTGESNTIRFSAQAGFVYRPCRPVSILFGVGYGYRTLTYKTNNYEDDGTFLFSEWHSYPERTYNGVDLSLGVLFVANGFAFSAEAVTTNFQTVEAKIGMGFCLPGK